MAANEWGLCDGYCQAGPGRFRTGFCVPCDAGTADKVIAAAVVRAVVGSRVTAHPLLLLLLYAHTLNNVVEGSLCLVLLLLMDPLTRSTFLHCSE